MGVRDRQPPRADVVIFTTNYCGYCVRAMRLLTSKGVAFKQIDVGGNMECRRWLLEATGMHTVPQVFINGRSVGGSDDIAELDGDGTLDRLLGEAPKQTLADLPCGQPPV